MMETVAAIAPDDVATIRQLGVAYSKLGNQLGNPNYPNVGDPAGALVELERSAAVFERRCLHIRPTPFSGGTWRSPTATSPTC